MHRMLATGLAALLALASSRPAHAQAHDAAPADDPWSAAQQAMQPGPRTIPLRDQANLRLPEGYSWLGNPHAARLMEAMGNGRNPDFLGLILPAHTEEGDSDDWMVTVAYEASGYISDDDAKHWDADALLQNLKDGTEAANAERARHGVTPMEVTRWIEPPAYDAATQRLVWSAEAHDKGAPAGGDDTVNYNTYVLGREGYVSLNLVTSTSAVEGQKPIARQLLSGVAFMDGKRYADFDAGSDKVAAYGLAALVGGVAAKKLGLLAVLAAFLAKSFKLVLVAIAAGGAALKRFFSRKA